MTPNSVSAWILLAQDVGEGAPLPWYLNGPWIPFLLIGVMFYLLMIRPEQRKRAQMADMLGGLKKNDRVVTIGGIHGIVVNASAESDEVTIRVDENNNTRLRVLRSAISRVDEGGESEETE